MKKTRKPSSTELPLLIEIDPEPIPEILTALGGVPLLVQTFRSLGLPGRVREQVRVKERERGYDEAEMVESFVVLNAVGGECFDDFQRLREDPGLSEMIGHGIPSPEAARKFLYQFHEEEKIEEAKGRRSGDEIAYIPEETEPLKGLGVVNCGLVRELGRRCPDQRIATVDQDATIIESRKQEALRTYVRRTGLPTDAGGVGGDERGAGRRIPGRECAGDDGSADGGEAGVCGAAGDGDDLLLPGRFGLSRKRSDQLAVRGTRSGRRGRKDGSDSRSARA